MRMVDFPVALPYKILTPQGGPAVLGSTVSETKYGQSVIDATGGLWRFSIDIGTMQGAMARAFSRLSVSAHAGANCFRLPFIDPHEPTYAELGLLGGERTIDQYVSWSNGENWSNGLPWIAGKPIANITAASAKDSGTITIDTSDWGGVVPTFFGIVGHFAVYAVKGVTTSGNNATCRVFPPVRKAITTSDYATLRPVMAAKIEGAAGAPWSTDRSRMTGARLNVVEVLDETVRTYVTEDFA